MKAFLLAAGLGTRLRPLTDTVPKCLVPIAGRPLLAYWIALLERHGFDEALINLHHLPEQVRDYVRQTPTRVRLTVFEEPTLLGSAGTVLANRRFVDDGQPFLVAYADNLTNADLGELMDAHARHRPMLTMALFRTSEPTRCGIAEVDGNGSGRILSFEEKPARPKSNLANAGLYVADARIVARIPSRIPADFGHDVLPGLVGEMHGETVRGELIDVGTHESYQRAQRAAAALGLFEAGAVASEVNQ